MILIDTSNTRGRRRHLQASAWYCVGYEKGKVAFAWLGAKYLNESHAQKAQNIHNSSERLVEDLANDTLRRVAWVQGP